VAARLCEFKSRPAHQHSVYSAHIGLEEKRVARKSACLEVIPQIATAEGVSALSLMSVATTDTGQTFQEYFATES